MISRLTIFLSISILWSNVLFSQTDTITDNSDCYLCAEEAHHSQSPYTINIKNEVPYIIIGGALATTGIILKYTNTNQPFTSDQLESLNRDQVNPFDRPATYNWSKSANTASDVLLLTSLFIPTILFTNHNTRSDIGPILIMATEVAFINFGITSSVKNIANRSRPYVYNTDLSDDQRTDKQSRFSFFSGHTSVTASFSFFFGKVMSDYHPNMRLGWKIGLWTLTAAIPATTGYLRIQAGKHYRTDVLAGYAIGAFTGWIVPHLHKKNKLSTNLSVYPARVFGTNGIGLTYKL